MARQAQVPGGPYLDELNSYTYQTSRAYIVDTGAVASVGVTADATGLSATASVGSVTASGQQTAGVTLSGFGMSAQLGEVTTGATAAPSALRQSMLYGSGYINEVSTASFQIRGAYVNSLSTSTVAETYSLSGPSSGNVGQASSVFTVTAVGVLSGSVVITPAATGGGTFSPTTVTLAPAAPSATFTYTPATTGSKTISVTNNSTLSNPSSITYTSNVVVEPPTGTITSQTASGQTVTISGTTTNTPTSATASLSPNGSGVTVGPVSVTLGTGTFTVTLTGVTVGVYLSPTITLSNSGGVAVAGGGSAVTILGVSGGFTAI